MNIEKLITLSRLRFNESEKEEIGKDLEKMIHFVKKIGEVDTSLQNDQSIVDYAVCQMREDEAIPELAGEHRFEASPFFQNGYFIVPKVIKQ